MAISGGYKCYNIYCNSCMGKTLCIEPGDRALSCVDRVVSSRTNADRIRAMSDEELAKFLSNFQDIGGGLGPDLCLEYIRKPAEEE